MGLTGLSAEKGSSAGSDALQLFVERAKRAHLGFSLTHEELPHAQAICDLVGGFPLGIELAAVWIKLLSPADIAAEIKQNLSFLESPTRDITERQRSINAAFEYSWKLLSREEQAVMRKLSVFNGGFRKEAAAQVVGASLPVLASLVDKSLLLVKSGSRYERHQLLFQFSQAKLAEHLEEEAETKAKHANYFHSFLKHAESDLRGPGAKEAMDTIEVEFENIRLAWEWAVEHEDAEALTYSAIPLRLFFDRRGRFYDGIDLYKQVMEDLDAANSKLQRAIGYALVSSAFLFFRLGENEKTLTAAQKGLKLLKPLKATKGIIEGLLSLSIIEWRRGDYDLAKRYGLEALDLAKSKDELATIARLSDYLGIIEENLGNYDKAKEFHRTSLRIYQELGNKIDAVNVYINLGTLEVNTNNLDEADHILNEGLVLAQELSVLQAMPNLLNNLAKSALAQGKHPRAMSLCKDALNLAQNIYEKPYQANIMETLGRISVSNGNYQQAKEDFIACLNVALETDNLRMTLQVLTWVAYLLSNKANSNQAAQIIGFTMNHPFAPIKVQKLAQDVLDELKKSLTVEEISRLLEFGKSLDLSFVVDMVVSSNNLSGGEM